MKKRSKFRWKKEWGIFIALVLALRIVYAVLGLGIMARGGPVALDASIYALLKPTLSNDRFSQLFINPWFQWDTVSYIKIAMLGYSPDASIVFMPLYPILIRGTAMALGGNYLLAALLLSTLFCVLTLVLLNEILGALYPLKNTRLALFFFMAFPTAFFLLAGYTESLFLALVLGFWLLARQGHWGWAALLAGLATLTRLQGILLAAVMLWMMLVSLVESPARKPLAQVRQVWELLAFHREKILRSAYKPAWLGVLTPVLTAVGYQIWLYRSGLGVMTEALQKYWNIETVTPWAGITLFFQRLFSTHYIYMDWIDLGLTVIVLMTCLLGLRLLDPAFSLYIWLTISVLLTRGTPPHLLASYSRYFLTLFPLCIIPAIIPKKALRFLLMSASFSLQILLVWIFLWGSWVA